MPMITTIEQQSGNTPTQLLADAGYCSDESLSAIAKTQIDAYISTRKQKHGERPGPCPRGPARKGIVEPVIGQIKQARGFRQFLLRGSRRCKVNGRWCVRPTTFSSCIASAREEADSLLGLGSRAQH